MSHREHKPKDYGRHLREVCERHDRLPLPEQRIQARKNRAATHHTNEAEDRDRG